MFKETRLSGSLFAGKCENGVKSSTEKMSLPKEKEESLINLNEQKNEIIDGK